MKRYQPNILKTGRTRGLNPIFGFLGFLGFTAFIGGSWSRFVFLGFFGFFYESKMSDTLIDERYRENKNKAQLMALKAASAVMLAALFFLPVGELFMSVQYLFQMLHILTALSAALVIFLSEYLLYRYDHDEYDNDMKEC